MLRSSLHIQGQIHSLLSNSLTIDIGCWAAELVVTQHLEAGEVIFCASAEAAVLVAAGASSNASEAGATASASTRLLASSDPPASELGADADRQPKSS